MIRSMTGFGRCDREVDGYRIRIEIRSVNHRYADFSIKIPRYYAFLEDNIRECLKQYIHRGKVDVFINIDSTGRNDKTVSLNEEYAASYVAALRRPRDEFGLIDDISAGVVAKNMDVFSFDQEEEDGEQLWAAVKTCLVGLLEEYAQMKAAEGERLKNDVISKLSVIEGLVGKIKELEPQAAAEYQKRLTEKVRELLADAAVDESRLLTEVAVFADKTAIDEELVRLGSHRKEFLDTLQKGGVVGKKLDFIVQEMNREINTIGSKANSLDVSRLVIEVKSELEKIREQIQNIE